MKKMQYSLKTLALLLPLCSSVALAEDANVNSSVTVQNTINFTVAAPLDFGTVAALADTSAGDNQSTMDINPDGSTAPTTNNSAGNSMITVIAAGTPADIQVTGAAPNTQLTITLPSTAIDLTDPSGNTTMKFTVDTFTKYAYLEGNNQTFGTTTDGSGNLSFRVGATLHTNNTGVNSQVNDPYPDLTYTGSFTVGINY